jgi:ABC-type nitrate/sulfonate/bicarbonate transport system permease component
MAGVSESRRSATRRPGPSAAARIAGAIGWIAARAISIVLLLVVWEALVRAKAVTPFMLPALERVVLRIGADAASGELFLNAGLTLYRAFAGFAIAGIGGVLLGMLIFKSAFARWFFDPIISAGFPMPKIAFLPIIILWVGVYDMPKITMIVIDAIFPVVTATILGFQGVDRHLVWSARNMGAREHEILWQIMLPAALPQILTGLQVALPVALIIAIATEMLMGGQGLGGAMLEASRMADSPGAFAGLVEMTVLGYIVIKGMALVRRRLLLWHQETQRPVGV